MNGWTRASRVVGAAVIVSLIIAVVLLILLLAADRDRAWAAAEKASAELSEIQSQKQGIPGTDGVDGESAYDIAVRLGYVGTEAEWIASLKGDTGATGAAGKNGANGSNGAPGGFTTVDIQCTGGKLKLLVNGVVSRDLGVYCF